MAQTTTTLSQQTQLAPLPDKTTIAEIETPRHEPSPAPEFALTLRSIQQAYTVLAVFCFTWAAPVVAAIFARGTLTLPVIGFAVYTEYVVYTLYAFSVLLPLLLGSVVWYRAVASSAGLSRRLPPPLFKNIEVAAMPAAFRVATFIVFVGLPVFAQELAYRRLYGEINIVWKPKKWWMTEDYSVGDSKKSLAKADLFTFPVKPESDRDYANWRFAKFPEVDTKPRPASREDDDGRPAWAKEREPVQISAAPGYIPWLFRLTAHGSIAVLLWLLLTSRELVAGVNKIATKLSLVVSGHT